MIKTFYSLEELHSFLNAAYLVRVEFAMPSDCDSNRFHSAVIRDEIYAIMLCDEIDLLNTDRNGLVFRNGEDARFELVGDFERAEAVEWDTEGEPELEGDKAYFVTIRFAGLYAIHVMVFTAAENAVSADS